MDVPGESSQTRDAFKILERYCQKRYQRVQSLLSVSRTEEHLNPLTPRQPFSPLIASTSRFLFQPPDQLPPPLQHSVSSLTTTPGSPAAFSPALSPDEEQKAFEAPTHPESRSSHIWRVLKFVYQKLGLKHVLILLIMIAYSLLGGLLFYHLEAEFDQAEREQKKQLIDSQRVEAADSIVHLVSNADCWFQEGPLFENSTERLLLLDSCNQQLNDLLDVLVERVQRHTCGPKSAWELLPGYGNLSCKTVEGRVATIFYALFGIPLFLLLLNLIGQVLFSACEATWKRTRQLLKRRARRIRRRLFSVSLRSHLKVGTADDKTETPNQMREMTEATVMAEEEEEEDRDIFQTFPLSLAFFLIFAYCLLCSLILLLLRLHLDDDHRIRRHHASHPHYSVGFFVFFIAGLALLSMCLELMKLRAENKYMQALQLIDDQHQALFATLPQPAIPPTITVEEEPSPPHNLGADASPRHPTWRLLDVR
ncbi:Twk-22 [Aphelenchoides fujianensis]|nr:Twk-22 [Aphelenchoides fujianensis]